MSSGSSSHPFPALAEAPRLGHLDLPGPHPSAWGPGGAPPGDPFTGSGALASRPQGSAANPCYGILPSNVTGSSLAAGCIGHDEPTVSFYSDVPGSGGNVTWDFTLPTEASAAANQSDLYAAAWVGLVASDPSAWLGQCYVEVQLYPDFNWTSPNTTVPGQWAGAVVGWQIDPGTGVVDLCYYAPLRPVGGPPGAYFSMAQGDRFTVDLAGAPGNPAGESVTVADHTTGRSAHQTLFNASGNYPLDPAYYLNQPVGALLWSTGGQAPVSFGFEIGRAGNSAVVANNSFGGCNPGPLPSLPGDPAVPCPSYDPLSWVNDTQAPWGIGVPVFGEPGANQSSSQVGFSSTTGGDGAVVGLSDGACTNRVGSSYCTYPWFGYSCSGGTFTFGATDFPAESNDFGQFAEYLDLAAPNALGIDQFTPDNFTVPSCGTPVHAVTVATGGGVGGSVYLLSRAYSNRTTVSGIPDGVYSLGAIAPVGAGFSGWAVTGGLAIGAAESPSTSLTVSGAGTVTAEFNATPPMTRVGFIANTPGAALSITPGLGISGGSRWSVTEGASVNLSAGVYTVQSAGPPGSLLVGWNLTAAGASLDSPTDSLTHLVVTAASTTTVLDATFANVSLSSNVALVGFGNGSVTLNGTSFAYNPATGYSRGNLSLRPGAYPATAVAAPGWVFLGWQFTPSLVLAVDNASTNVSLSGTIGSLTALFGAQITTDIPGSVAGEGAVALAGVGPLANGTTSTLERGIYQLVALPSGYHSFVRWTVSSSAALWVYKTSYPITRVMVNDTGTIAAAFQNATNVSVRFVNSPANGGTISFNYETVAGASTLNDSLATGAYLLRATANPGYSFSGFTVSAPNSFAGGILTVTGGGGTVTAHFATVGYPVSFVTGPHVQISADINSVVVNSGGAVGLPSGTYPLAALVGTNSTFLKWVTTGHLAVTNVFATASNLSVSGAGTLSVLAEPFALAGIQSSTPSGDVGLPVTFTALVRGLNPASFLWTGLPSGCASRDAGRLTCTPSVNGTSSVVVKATGTNGLSVFSAPLGFAVGPRLVLVSLNASLTSLEIGSTTVLTATVRGGTVPLTYRYDPLPVGCPIVNSSTFACTPTATGTTTIELTVQDLLGEVAYGNVTLTVAPRLVLTSFVSSLSSVTVGIPFELFANVTGGAPPVNYAYRGLPTGCLPLDAPTITCTPVTAGNLTLTLNATDAQGTFVTESLAVTVNPLPSVLAFHVSPQVITTGENVTFSVVATGGTGALHYTYASLPTPCVSTDAASLRCAPDMAGNYTVAVIVTDSLGASSPAASTLVQVAPPHNPAGGVGANGLPWWIWAVIAAVILAALVLGALMLRRRSHRRTQ